MNNFLLEKFRQDIIEVLNNSNLLLGSAYYILKDILKELEEEYYKVIQKQKDFGIKNKTEEIKIPNNITIEQQIIKNQDQPQS